MAPVSGQTNMPDTPDGDAAARERPVVTVVDDDASIRRALARLVRSSGLEARTFESAEEYLNAAHPEGARCLVIDVHLGGMSGLDLLERLGASGAAPAAIVITANDTSHSHDRAHELGAVAFITKPYDATVLLDAIDQALGRDLGAGR
jgi:FixJ family two-component response regulator